MLGHPVAVIGAAAVPVVLIAYGLSLHGQRVLGPGPDRFGALVAAALKTLAMPAIAFLLALAVGLDRHATYAVTVLAALPTAQNIFVYAQRFQTGLTLVRDAILLSTAACVPVLVLLTILFTR
jgi:predicted permease